MSVSHPEAPVPQESTSSGPTFQPVLPYDASQPYQNAAAYHQPMETYQLPSAYEHNPSYEQQGTAYHSAPDYETPSSSSYQPVSLEQPMEHMTARERFARRNRQAMESMSYSAAENHHTSINALEPMSTDHSSSTMSMNCETEGGSNSTQANCLESAPGNMHEGNSDCFDPYSTSSEHSANLGEASMNTADSLEPGEGYSSAVAVPRKKGSIFKSRGHGSDDNKKRLALYKHKWSDNQEGGASTSQQAANTAVTESQGNSSLLFPFVKFKSF